MNRSIFMVITLLFCLSILSACGQEKVMDTESIRLQNKVKDLETKLSQFEEEHAKFNQKLTDLETMNNQLSEQMAKFQSVEKELQVNEKHPVIIQDVKLTSSQMDADGRIWGPFDINVTLYNGTDRVISDQLAAIVMVDHPNDPTGAPQTQPFMQKFELQPKEAKLVSFSGLPISSPDKRHNIILKLLENASTTEMDGVTGKATWIVVPTIIFPPKSS